MQPAWFNDDKPHTAFKLRLCPLELGHLFILRTLQSPYLVDSEIQLATRYDAMIFAFVTCSNYERANKRMASPLFSFWLKLYRMIARKCDLKSEHDRIMAFVKDQFQTLDMAYEKRSASSWVSETPHEYSLLCSAITELNMSIEEAMKTPIRMLSNIIAVRSTQTGPASILNDNQRRWLNGVMQKRKEVEQN